MMPHMSDLLVEPQAGWVRLTLNRPAARNALNTALLADLAGCLAALAEDPACRVAVITGADGNFAAGADIGEIQNLGGDTWSLFFRDVDGMELEVCAPA